LGFIFILFYFVGAFCGACGGAVDEAKESKQAGGVRVCVCAHMC
jgi:hypothetical protein